MRSFVPIALALFACSCAPRLVPAEAGSFRAPRLQAAADKVIVVPSQDVGEATEVLGVLDVREATGGQEAALRTLKQRAALLGADAVIGVELHRGPEKEKEGALAAKEAGPETHLSGVAVRRHALLG